MTKLFRLRWGGGVGGGLGWSALHVADFKD